MRVEVESAVINLTSESVITGNTSIGVLESRGSSQGDDLAPLGDVFEIGRFGRIGRKWGSGAGGE